MKNIFISIFVALVLIGGAFWLGGNKGSVATGDLTNANNVFMENGKQIVEIKARGGYNPKHSVAKAGVPTILRFNAKGTFDCSASVYIPSLKFSKILDQSSNNDIEIGTSTEGVLNGTCGMGMYSFDINFKN
jgi:plastocyanin domain-containing protein